MSTEPSTFGTVVSKDEFFAYIGPKDIVIHNQPNHTEWQTRNQDVIGVTTPGYANGYVDGKYVIPTYRLLNR